MSMITRVKGVPVFSKASEALIWGSEYGITNYHVYKHGNEKGYIAGSNLSRPRRMMKLSLKEKVKENRRSIQARAEKAVGNKIKMPWETIAPVDAMLPIEQPDVQPFNMPEDIQTPMQPMSQPSSTPISSGGSSGGGGGGGY